MKIIISHDVDHLYPSDHIFKDFIFPKLWIRSFFEFLKGEISFKCYLYRLFSIFDKRLNRMPEIIDFDKRKKIPSTFFFGMANLLGLSYNVKKAKLWIKFVMEKGFDVGVHGIDFEHPQKEFETFKQISGLTHFGIRTHYVRYNSSTFNKFAETGYLFDCSEFNKLEIELKNVYKVNNMWEFPLHIMDGYILKNGQLDVAISTTKKVLKEAEANGVEYFSLLFHDYMYNDNTYPIQKKYYEWFVNYCEMNNYRFISYNLAINELKNHN